MLSPSQSPPLTPISTPKLTITPSHTLPLNPKQIEISIDDVNQVVQLTELEHGEIQDFSISPNGDLLALASSEGLWVYKLNPLEVYWSLSTERKVLSVDYHPEGDLMAFGLADGEVSILNFDSKEEVYKIESVTEDASFMAWSPDGNKLAWRSSPSNAQQLAVWDLQSNSILFINQTESGNKTPPVWSPDSKYILSNQSFYIDVIQSHNGESGYMFVIENINEGIWSTTGEKVIISHDDFISLYGFQPVTYYGDIMTSFSPEHMVISPDGKTLAIATQFDMTTIWDVDTGEHLFSLGEYNGDGYTTWVAWEPDGRYVVSNSRMGGTTFWDIQTGEKLHGLATPLGYRGYPRAEISPQGDVLIYLTVDKTLVLLGIPE
jgi:WD40 repeat protein